jgi:hypothetical protein
MSSTHPTMPVLFPVAAETAATTTAIKMLSAIARTAASARERPPIVPSRPRNMMRAMTTPTPYATEYDNARPSTPRRRYVASATTMLTTFSTA